MMAYFVYILYSDSINKFYTGQTNDIDQRIKRHNSGAEKFTSKGVPWELVWCTSKDSRSEAIILERKLKNLKQARIVKFMLKYSFDIQNLQLINRLQKNID